MRIKERKSEPEDNDIKERESDEKEIETSDNDELEKQTTGTRETDKKEREKILEKREGQGENLNR